MVAYKRFQNHVARDVRTDIIGRQMASDNVLDAVLPEKAQVVRRHGVSGRKNLSLTRYGIGQFNAQSIIYGELAEPHVCRLFRKVLQGQQDVRRHIDRSAILPQE